MEKSQLRKFISEFISSRSSYESEGMEIAEELCDEMIKEFHRMLFHIEQEIPPHHKDGGLKYEFGKINVFKSIIKSLEDE